jgi:NTP pyrophosphatase (non-canonical NTP hydrolase)
MYYLYHIPGKKIGVTRDLNTRVTLIQGYKENETLIQGYKENEYEVLEQSDDIDYISDREIELQKSYGYKTDRQLYKHLFNKMDINPTEQTSTFPVPVSKLKGRLMDNIGLTWRTYHGQFEINEQTIPWIMANVKTSMYNEDRCYIYNKAYYEAFLAEPALDETTGNVFDDIRSWATDKGIYDKGDARTQYLKLMEESGELAEALLKNDKAEIQDAIGDMIVVLTSIAKFEDMFIEDCIKSAYDVIAKRTGKMVNGTFVKDAD